MQKQFLSFLATGAILLSTITPSVLADSTLSVSGNGAGSTSNVSSTSNNSSTLVQDNNATVTNNVSSNSNTGGNNADENTGGNVTVDTGNATALTDIATRANANVADLSTCGCTTLGNGQSITVSGNGAQSNTNATVNNTNTSSLFQNNNASVANDVSSNAQTGNNNANRNTGGDVLVLTGHAANDTMLRTAVNANMANMGSSTTGVGSGTGSLWVVGNGFGSNNDVNVTDNNAATLVQGNTANIQNRVNSNAQTGRNNADENTGGNVTVDTGNALNTTRVDTMANFNSADLANCGCTTTSGFLGKVFGNGAESRNTLNTFRNDTMSVFQGGENGNTATVVNDVNNKGQTGYNNAQRNTGAVFGMIDPVDVISGHSGTNTTVSTQTGVNMFGPTVSLPGGTDVNFTFDLNGLLGMLNL